MFTMFILPIFQSYNFCAGIGVDIKGKSIAIKNDEINYLNCQWSNVNGCILDEGSNQKMSCVITNYFVSQQYKLVSLGMMVFRKICLLRTSVTCDCYHPTFLLRE